MSTIERTLLGLTALGLLSFAAVSLWQITTKKTAEKLTMECRQIAAGNAGAEQKQLICIWTKETENVEG
ncbi:MAG: hypothetical protein AAF442_05320 [Pseudomonadota bacterium]